MSRKRTPKAKSMKILDEATMTYRMVYLYDVTFRLKNGGVIDVQVYAPSDAEVFEVANRLYANKGAFGAATGFVRA